MAHTRARSTTTTSSSNLAHALSLKVLRLSRPSLAVQTPLSATEAGDGNGLRIPPRASLAYPQPDAVTPSTFPLTPLLTLPPAFGAAYVGEEFTCTLCANHDGAAAAGAGEDARRVRDVRISAEMLLPGHNSGEKGIPIKLYGAETMSRSDAESKRRIGGSGIAEAGEGSRSDEEEEEEETGAQGETDFFPPGTTLQRTLRYELRDEGTHQLAVTVTYTELLPPFSDPASASTSSALSAAAQDAGGEIGESRTRTFKKLYQFVAQPLVAVRSKVSERRRPRRDNKTNNDDNGASRGDERQWILEAQLENVGEVSVVLERVRVWVKEGIASLAVNDRVRDYSHDHEGGGGGGDEDEEETDGKAAVVLKPQDVEQVMFMLTELPGVRKVPEEEDDEEVAVGVGRIALAQIHVNWRAAMGERGSLTTGWLGTRRR